jgi:DnaJ-domain-containing protein 1
MPRVPPVAPAVPPARAPLASAPAVPALPAVPTVPPTVPAARPEASAPQPPPAAGVGGPGNLDAQQRVELAERTAALDTLDYFELLKVEHTAAPADIKRAFYRESRTYHPDRFFQLDDALLKERVHDLYKRVTEAYYVLRDDVRRRQYLADVTGPDRARKLRFTEASEVETKAAVKREQEEQIGSHPKGRQFFQTAQGDVAAERWASAERNLKMALTYEPQNARYKERLQEVQKALEALRKRESPAR